MSNRKKKPKQKQKVNNVARAKRLVKGLTISWESDEPLEAGTKLANATISHKIPLMRLTVANVISDFGEYITNKQAFLWRVNITVVFRYPNGVDDLIEREMVAHCVLSNLNEHCHKTVAEAKRRGAEDRYLTTRFKVECLGDRAPRDEDYTFSEDYESEVV